MDQAVTRAQAAIETLGLSDPPDPSDSQTPLGEPLDQVSAAALAKDPLAWHLRYWLDLCTVGNLRGEDEILLALRMEIEVNKILDMELHSAFYDAWFQYVMDNSEESARNWIQRTLESDEAKRYLRDIDRMLEDKARKTRHYLGHLERLMLTSLQEGDAETAKMFFQKLAPVYPKLLREEAADTARNSAK